LYKQDHYSKKSARLIYLPRIFILQAELLTFVNNHITEIHKSINNC